MLHGECRVRLRCLDIAVSLYSAVRFYGGTMLDEHACNMSAVIFEREN